MNLKAKSLNYKYRLLQEKLVAEHHLVKDWRGSFVAGRYSIRVVPDDPFHKRSQSLVEFLGERFFEYLEVREEQLPQVSRGYDLEVEPIDAAPA